MDYGCLSLTVAFDFEVSLAHISKVYVILALTTDYSWI